MNKTELINRLSNELTYSKEECYLIGNIFEKYFFLSQNGKNKILEELCWHLNADKDEALRLYTLVIQIIKGEVKNKLKHPFKSLD